MEIMSKEFKPAIVFRKTEELIPYVNNSRTHSDKQVDQLAASMKEFGFTNPILTDGESVIIAGHGRLLAARKLGLAKVPTIELGHLSKTQRKALVIADNKLAMNADWDPELLKIEIETLAAEGFDLPILGFSEENLEDVLSFGFEPEAEDDSALAEDGCSEIDAEGLISDECKTCPRCGFEYDA